MTRIWRAVVLAMILALIIRVRQLGDQGDHIKELAQVNTDLASMVLDLTVLIKAQGERIQALEQQSMLKRKIENLPNRIAPPGTWRPRT